MDIDILGILITVACASIVLMFLVFIHEGGHYLASRAFGVRVSEFMIGFPGPGLKFKHGETRFGVTIVPLGGYARVCGMEAGHESPHLEQVLACMYRRGTADVEDVAEELGLTFDQAQCALDELVEWGSLTPPKKSDQYNTYRVEETARPSRKELRKLRAAYEEKRRSARSSEALDAKAQVQTAASGELFEEGAPGKAVAFQSDGSFDRELSEAPAYFAQAVPPVPTDLAKSDVNKPWYPKQYVEGQARADLAADPHELYERERSVQYRALPFWKRSVILLAGILVNLLFAILCFVVIYSVLGFDYQYPDTGEVVHVAVDPLRAISAGFMYIGMVVQAVVSLFNPATAADTVSNSTSIVGIAVMSKSAFEQGFESLLSFMAMISVSLGIMNLLPIPPLDGGRFLVEIIQKISGHTVSTRAMNVVTMAGMAFFLLFFVFMLNQDVQRFVFGNW